MIHFSSQGPNKKTIVCLRKGIEGLLAIKVDAFCVIFIPLGEITGDFIFIPPLPHESWKITFNYTMLQKLAKCEVKAWHLKFGHFTSTHILREIQFWRIQTVKKRHFWQFLRFSILILVNLSNFQVLNLPKIQSSESMKLPKMTLLDCLNSPKLDFT